MPPRHHERVTTDNGLAHYSKLFARSFERPASLPRGQYPQVNKDSMAWTLKLLSGATENTVCAISDLGPGLDIMKVT